MTLIILSFSIFLRRCSPMLTLICISVYFSTRTATRYLTWKTWRTRHWTGTWDVCSPLMRVRNCQKKDTKLTLSKYTRPFTVEWQPLKIREYPHMKRLQQEIACYHFWGPLDPPDQFRCLNQLNPQPKRCLDLPDLYELEQGIMSSHSINQIALNAIFQ